MPFPLPGDRRRLTRRAATEEVHGAAVTEDVLAAEEPDVTPLPDSGEVPSELLSAPAIDLHLPDARQARPFQAEGHEADTREGVHERHTGSGSRSPRCAASAGHPPAT